MVTVHTCLMAFVHVDKIDVSSGIFHGIAVESIAYLCSFNPSHAHQLTC